MSDKEKLIAEITRMAGKLPYDLLRKLFITASVFAEYAEKGAGNDGE